MRLIQEDLGKDPWRQVVATTLLNKTPGEAVRPVLRALLERHPTAASLAGADRAELEALLEPLGLQRRRADSLVRLSAVLAGIEGTPSLGTVAALPGVGKYALDSYMIFVLGVLPDPEDVTDEKLRRYLEGVERGRRDG